MTDFLQGIAVRRSKVDDIPAIREIIGDDDFIFSKRYGDDFNIHAMIELNFLSITAVDENDSVVGFATFNDFPGVAGIPPAQWDKWLHCGWLQKCDALARLQPCNTLWLQFIACTRALEYELPMKMLASALATVPQVFNFLFALNSDAPPFTPVKDIMAKLQESDASLDDCLLYKNNAFRGSIYHVHRTSIIPELRLRQGIVEDYDDLMPLLLGGEGVVTPLPPTLYLEELLQEQDEYRSVVVAEDPTTGAVVGLMCLLATFEEQQKVVDGYNTDAFNRLKPMFTQKHKGQQAGHNVFHITFFYLNPEYDTRAAQFLPHAFDLFPFAEYCYINLPHAAPEHALLHHFAYVPIKKFKPANLQVQNERLVLPEGLWLCCRYALEDIEIGAAQRGHEEGVAKLMRGQTELSPDTVEAMTLAVSQSLPVEGRDDAVAGDAPFASYVVQWRDQVVGCVTIRHVAVEELYTLRENFDVDEFVNFVPFGNQDYSASNIALDPLLAKTSFYKNDVPTIVIKQFYIKPVFRGRVRTVLREVLRLSKAQAIVHLAGVQTEVFSPLLQELILVAPRRMVDMPADAQHMGDDVDSLVCLHHTSRRALSDEKTKIHARIVVIGAGTTGLAFLWNLLRIPYLHFSNLVLVSQDGLPEHPNHSELLWTVDTMDWLEREFIYLKVGKKVRIVEGTMTDFERQDKFIYTDGKTWEPYDHLVITAGRQYAIPKEMISQHGAKNGVFPLSNALYISKIKEHIDQSEIYEDELSNAVIYGSSLDVYCIATCIISLGLVPQRVAIVSPEPAERSPFNDPLIDLKVETLFETLGIKLYKGHVLERLEYDEDNDLTMVSIVPADGPKSKVVDLSASMFIYADQKDIDIQVLSALNKRSIVFDGRVIIENNYRTTDECIYAAGPVAMFSRRFGESQDFELFSAKEVGRHVAETVLGFLGIEEYFDDNLHNDSDKALAPKDDPLAAELGSTKVNEKGEDVRRRPKPLPQFKENVCRRVVLPSNFVFFTCHTLNYREIASQCTHLTSTSSKGNSYVRLCVGPNRYIESVSYFGDEPIELFNLRSLVGMPESTLNIVYNYNETRDESGNHALDILQFLRAPWAHTIFYDRFQKQFDAIRSKLREHPDVVRVCNDLQQLVAKETGSGIRISDEERAAHHSRLTHEHSDARHLIELELLKFLHRNKCFLPQQYFLPDISAHVAQHK